MKKLKKLAFVLLGLAVVAIGHHTYYGFTHMDQTQLRNIIENWPSVLVFASLMGAARILLEIGNSRKADGCCPLRQKNKP